MSRALRALRYLVLLVLILVSTVAMTLFYYLQGSLPVLEGNHIVPGLRAKVDVARDDYGVPTLFGTHREDIAFGLGFLHAQERFFQMDLLRRQPAGELSALLGAGSLTADRQRRPYQMRALAGRVIADAGVRQRSIIESYTRGVNQGLQTLSQPPFEYLLLQSEPEPWVPEDSVLVMLSRSVNLHEQTLDRALSLEALHRHLPEDWSRFMLQDRGEWDAPLDDNGSPALSSLPTTPLQDWGVSDRRSHALPRIGLPGGDALAVSGAFTEDGHALLASNDYLPLELPATWYRARWQLLESGHRATGLTLPGNPIMFNGSNEQVAWTFTNTLLPAADIIRLQVRDNTYLTADGWEPFRVQDESIAIRGSSPQVMQTRHTRWGPVIGQDDEGRWLALRWSALSTEGVDLTLLDMENVTTIAEALQYAEAGIPTQNLVVADRAGDIAWSLAGPLPGEGVGSAPLAGADLTTNDSEWWNRERPTLLGRDHLWLTGHRTLTTHPALQRGDHDLGVRGQQMRDQLLNLEQASEQALLDIQLDDGALLHERWRAHLLALLEQINVNLNASLLAELESDEPLRARPDSLAYPLVRAYRQAVLERTLGPVYAQLAERSRVFDVRHVLRQVEYPLWALTNEAPESALNPAFDNWEALWEDALLAAMDATSNELGPLTWSQQNDGAWRHPLSQWVPALAPALNLPADGLPGDYYMPRIQGPQLSASQRMVVAPGREHEGLFHQAGSQSGHPISPYYRIGHSDWLNANPAPLLPGPARYQMSLFPQR
ncbi:MAG: penicillin acylase family protein [Natronospirillum sp.]|uniref:penicillin acylase family protein n=1 Tax=Natronospirillum sp. TaxID=2812955 RepID=UPI0025FA74E6|nr:penicillin acylase family protein [Natronospirillum sp.]MCH8551643.1 penicillin acylase family protein [Natronospirillum sp.]